MLGRFYAELDKKYALGFIIGIVFSSLGFYADFLRSNNPVIEYDVLSNTTVVDINEKIGKINIFYDSVSILSSQQAVSLITVKISNSGNANVLKTYYDDRFPLGLDIIDAQILERPSIIQSSSNYISQSIGLKVVGINTINFADFIFEQNDYFVLKILVLHKISRTPQIIPHGKIAGVKKIKINRSYLNKETKTIWERIIDGSFIIHFYRLLIYLVVVSVLTLSILLIIFSVKEQVLQSKRKQKFKRFQSHLGRELNEPEIAIKRFYINYGIDPLKQIQKVSSRYLEYKIYFDNDYKKVISNLKTGFFHLEYKVEAVEIIHKLKKSGYIKIVDDKIVFKDNSDVFLGQLITFMR